LDARSPPDKKAPAPSFTRHIFHHSTFLHIPWQRGKKMRGAGGGSV